MAKSRPIRLKERFHRQRGVPISEKFQPNRSTRSLTTAATPLTAQKLVDILHESGVPASYLQTIHGSGSEVGLRLLRDPRIGFGFRAPKYLPGTPGIPWSLPSLRLTSSSVSPGEVPRPGGGLSLRQSSLQKTPSR